MLKLKLGDTDAVEKNIIYYNLLFITTIETKKNPFRSISKI